MNEPQTFRSAFNGFNREDVVNHIAYMNTKHESQVKELRSENDALRTELEELRAQGKDTRQLHAHLRTPLCAMVAILVFEFIHVIYIYLSGVQLDAGHIQRALIDVVYTMLLAALLQFPVRAWLGIYRQNRENRERQQNQGMT